MIVVGILLYLFYLATCVCSEMGTPEGFQVPGYMRSTWSIVSINFILTILYLPISTMALHVLVWSNDLWVVPNPYINATTYPPQVPPLGPPDEFRDPLDFCYTTTMKRNEVNFAPVIFIVAALCFAAVCRMFSPYFNLIDSLCM